MTENYSIERKSNFLTNRIVFLIHLFLYAGVNLLLLLIWGLGKNPDKVFWPVFPFLGWGIAIALHSVTYLAYNDKVKFLSKIVQEGSRMKILFMYHATLYASIMLLLVFVDIMRIPGGFTGNFVYAIVVWGILVLIHGIGFSSFNKLIEKQMTTSREKTPEASEKKIRRDATVKIGNAIAMLMHTGLFIVLNGLLFFIRYPTMSTEGRLNFVMGTIAWGILLALHVIAYVVAFHTKLPSKWKVLVVSIAAFVAFGASTMIRNIYETELLRYWHYPVVVMGIWVGVLVLVALLWNPLMRRAQKRIAKNGRSSDLEDFEVQTKAKRLIYLEWSWVAHVIIYVVGLVLMNSPNPEVYSIYGLGILFIPALGWLIGLAVHAIIVFIVWKPVKNKLNISLLIHVTAYVFTGILLVALNLIVTPGAILWSAIALGGWALALGFHAMIKVFIKKQ